MKDEIKLATAPWCGGCEPVKIFAVNHGIPYTILNVDKDMGTATTLGVKSLPALIVNDEVVASGTTDCLNKLKEYKWA